MPAANEANVDVKHVGVVEGDEGVGKSAVS